MEGIEGAAVRIADRLRDRLDATTARMRDRYGTSDLPDVVTVQAFDDQRIGVEDWPAVLVVPQDTIDLKLDQTNGVTESWRCRYALRAYVFVRGVDEETVSQRRYRITLAVREVLMASRAFGPVGVHPNTLRESYSEVTRTPDVGSVAASWIAFEVTAAEELVVDVAVGQVPKEGVTIDTGVIPQHPGL